MPETLSVVTLVGSLRRASFNAAIARALPDLAPEGMRIMPLGSVGEFPLYGADVQAAGFPLLVPAEVPVTTAPSAEELRVLRERVDWVGALR